MAGDADTFVLLCTAFIFPPAAVAFLTGCGGDLCLNILLTLIGFLPGCIHAFWLVLKRSEANERYGYGNWIYVGMGEYHPRSSGPFTASRSSGQVPPPPPPSAQPQAAGPPPGPPPPPPPPPLPPPPPTPPPPPPSASEEYPSGKPSGATQAPVDPKSGGQVAEPPAPAYTEHDPPTEPGKQ